jgi:anion-transporting  ArsA/GET3 family ATPase
MRAVSSTSTRRLSFPASRRVILCVGPGGVGKTTVAAALGLAAARAGHRTIVVTIDPSRRLAQALGFGDDGSDRGTIVRVRGTRGQSAPLDGMLLDTQQVFDEIVRGYSPSPQAAHRMLENPIYRATVRHLGGALEYAATARVHMLVQDGDYDLVILDTPPTANAIEFLEAPVRINEVLSNPAAKFLASSSRIGMKFMGLASGVMMKAFEALGGGPFIGQLGQFLADFGAVLGEFQRRAGDVAQLLTSPETGVVLTTSANEFSVREAKAFLQVLGDRGMRIDGLVLNRVEPTLPSSPGRASLEGPLAEQLGPQHDVDATLGRITEIYEDAREQSERSAQVLADLERTYPRLPRCVLPRVDPPPITLEELAQMGDALWDADDRVTP